MKFRVSLAYRLFAGLVLVAVTGASIAGYWIDRTVSANSLQGYQQRLLATSRTFGQMTASALFGDLDPSDTSLNAPVQALAHQVDTHLSLVTPDGALVADSELADPRTAGSQGAMPEVIQARANREGTSVRQGRLWVAAAIVRDGRILGIARASVPMTRVQEHIRAVRRQVYGAGVASCLVAMLLGVFISVGIVRPVRRLAHGARRIGAGELGYRVKVESRDELGELAGALNDMSGSLATMVSRVEQRNQDMRLVLDNVEQGLCTAGPTGELDGERSALVDQRFGPVSPGTRVWDLFRDAPAGARESLAMNWEQVFDGILPLELCLAQMPARVVCGPQHYAVTYVPVRSGDTVVKLLVVISDVTAAVHAEAAEAEQRDLMATFEGIGRSRGAFETFLTEGRALLDTVCTPGVSTAELKRALHTLKGISGLTRIQRVASQCHALEEALDVAGADGALTDTDRTALKAVWEPMEARALAMLGDRGGATLDVRAEDVTDVLKQLTHGGDPRAIARMIESWRREAVDRRLEQFGEQARQLAERLGKPAPAVAVEARGVRLDARRWAGFWSALSHVIRNAVDHGLETHDERVAAGKPAHGSLELRASADAEGVTLEVQDDGRGIAWESVARKARERGLPADSVEALTAALFADGVSTRDTATEVSGRGVGMGALLAATRTLGGSIEVDSRPGAGTTFRFRFPHAVIHRPSFRPLAA